MTEPRLWGLVAAAGRGERMGPDTPPKQYHRLAGRCVLDWSIAALRSTPGLAGLIVVRPADDAGAWAQTGLAADPTLLSCRGGASRQVSVQRGLEGLREAGAAEADFVLVHDAARPAVKPACIARLIAAVAGDRDGGLLAVPLRDTLKRADNDGRVAATPARDGLWLAMTPQLFPLGRLHAALEACGEMTITDEAQAMERLGARPRLVAGDPGNIKYTYAEDAVWLEQALAGNAREAGQ